MQLVKKIPSIEGIFLLGLKFELIHLTPALAPVSGEITQTLLPLPCNGLIKLDTNLGDNVFTKEVFYETETYIYSRIQTRSSKPCT